MFILPIRCSNNISVAPGVKDCVCGVQEAINAVLSIIADRQEVNFGISRKAKSVLDIELLYFQ